MSALASGNLSPTSARIYGWAAILAPVLLLASSVLFITEGDGINDGVLGGTVGVWSCFALAIAFVGILRLLEPTAPRAAPILAILALTGFAAGVAFNVQAIFTAYFGPEIDDFMQVIEGSDLIAILAFLPWGWFVPLTFAATGLVLWRTPNASRLPAGLLIAGGVLFVASRPARVDALAVIGDCVTLLALVPIGWAILAGVRPRAPIPAPAPAA